MARIVNRVERVVNRVAEFEKVSSEQFEKDGKKHIFNARFVDMEKVYENITLPVRATKQSAGHDIRIPFDCNLAPGVSAMIPTGLKCKMEEGYVMMVFPRSSLGIKHRMALNNTTGIIDCDYYNNPDNEGHIFVSVRNNGDHILQLKAGDKIVQALFVPFGVADQEGVITERTGGIGSTGRD